MAEMSDAEKNIAVEAAKTEAAVKKPKKKKKKELSPEEIAAQKELERNLIKGFYLQKWEEVKKKSQLFVTYQEEGFPGADFQVPCSEADMLPILQAVYNTQLVPFMTAMDSLSAHSWFRKDDLKRYSASAQKYADFLVQKSQGAGASNLPPLPGFQPKKRVELRSRFIIEYITQKASDRGLMGSKVEGEPNTIEVNDEVCALNTWEVEWYPFRDVQKMEKPKEKGEVPHILCKNPKCETKNVFRTYFHCGACGTQYCSLECQKDDWPAHQYAGKRCNATLNKGINIALKKRDLSKMTPMLQYLKLFFCSLAKINVHEGYVWYAMAYLKEKDWEMYSSLVPKEKSAVRAIGGKEGGDTFVWPCFTSCTVSKSKTESLFNRKEVSRCHRILFEIKAIEGYKISQYVEPPESTSPVGSSEEKDEVILPPGSAFRVVTSVVNGTLLHLTCEQTAQQYGMMDTYEPEELEEEDDENDD